MKKSLLKASLMMLLFLVGGGNAMAQTVYYSADYEDEVADWTTGNADRYTVSIKGNETNHYLSVDAVGTGNNGTTITCNATNGVVPASTDFFMSFDIALAGGNNQASSFYIYDSSNSKAILELTQNAAGNYTGWTINGSKALNYSAKSANCTYNIAVKNGTVYFTITDGSNVKYDKEIIATEVSGLGKMVFNTKRYYAGMTIDNVVVRELQEGDVPAAEPFNYAVTAVDENNEVIKVLTNGSSTEPLGYYNPIIINNNGNYYIAKNTSTFANTISSENNDIKVVYTLNNNIVAYAEAETSTKSTEGNYSNGSVGYVAAQNYTNRGIGLGTLQPGKYQMIVNITANNTRNVALRNSSFATTAEVDNIICSAVNNGKNVLDFELLEQTSILVNGKNSGTKSNQSADFDYVYIVKTGDATVSCNVSAAGYATFSCAGALDLDGMTEGFEAYKVVSVGGDVVTTEKVEGTVAAGTGLIIKGQGECVIPVVAEGATVEDNLLVATTGEDITSGYVLGLEGEKVMFLQIGEVAAQLAAGKAYLPAQVSNARALRIANESTGITNVATAAKANVMYNIAGQRVSDNAKGIVIVNGKKFNNK